MTHLRTFAAAALSFLLITAQSGAQTVRCTTWNLEWFPNGSANETSTAQQEQRIKAAADVLRPINPDIILLQEVRDYDACARFREAIAPGVYHVAGFLLGHVDFLRDFFLWPRHRLGTAHEGGTFTLIGPDVVITGAPQLISLAVPQGLTTHHY